MSPRGKDGPVLSEFGKVLSGGSRLIFWALTPIVLLFVIVTPFSLTRSSTGSVILLAGVDLTGILLVLALYNQKRFHWAGRAATGLVFPVD